MDFCVFGYFHCIIFQTFYFVSDLDFVKKAVGLDYKCDVRFDAIDLDIYEWHPDREQSVCLGKQKIIISI